MAIFCLIKDNKIANAIVSDRAFAEKIKTEKGYDDIIERTAGKTYSKDFVFDDIESDFIHPQIIKDREVQ
jgi:hypothetical protein